MIMLCTGAGCPIRENCYRNTTEHKAEATVYDYFPGGPPYEIKEEHDNDGHQIRISIKCQEFWNNEGK